MRFLVLKKRSIALFAALLLAVTALALFFSGSGRASFYFGDSLRKIPIYRVDTQEKKVALTFDAAWGADKTEKILEILEQNGADATFFLVGFWMESYPDVTKKIAQSGKEIGTHSNTHAHMSRQSAEDIKTELSVSSAKIESLTGVVPTLFRAPFGEYNDRVLTTAEGLNLTTIQWDVDSLDWKSLPAQDIIKRVISRTKPGSIVLFHNNSDHILTVLPAVLMTLKEKGYSFVKVSDLIYRENAYVDSKGEQRLVQSQGA